MVQPVRSNHRVLFENADGNINMGFLVDDPRNKTLEIYWMQLIGFLMEESLKKKEGRAILKHILEIKFLVYLENISLLGAIRDEK